MITMDSGAEIQWPNACVQLKTMDNLLKCQICYDYMDTPVMTTCSHNYCSLCIRRYLHYKTRCPICFKATYENELRPNRILEEIIINFTKIQEMFENIMHKNEKKSDVDVTNNMKFVNDKKLLQKQVKHKDNNHNEIQHKGDEDDKQSNKLDSDQTTTVLCQTSLSTSVLAIDNQQKTSVEIDSQNTNTSVNSENCIDESKYICSVCRVEIPVVNKNIHVKVCSARESSTVLNTIADIKRKPLPKLVINLMKDAELKRKMKELGLPTQGTRKNLESRYHRYCTLHNAECDKKAPRSIAELLKQCKDDEALEKKLAKVS